MASSFVASAIAAETSIPVLTFPLPVESPSPTTLTRSDISLPEDRFVFSFVFDFYSTVERKNPCGLIEAYTRAFGPSDGALLLLKSINGESFPDEMSRLREARAGRTSSWSMGSSPPTRFVPTRRSRTVRSRCIGARASG